MAGPGTNNSETPYPIWGFDPPSPEPDTKKLDALLASLNGSAERFQTLWFSFLGLTLYLAIAALATTHRDLLLNNPQTLPILNIKVELLPFYVIAPLLYLVFHFYLLMMLALLARTAAEFDKQLRTTLPGEPERERYRAQIGNALFLQLLVGMKGERTGVNALLMGLIALITIVLAPLATLVLMQMMFLPYHHLRITWWHRGIVVADLVLIVVMTYRCFFPRGVRKAPLVLGALNRKPRWAAAMAFCVLLAVMLAPLVDWVSFRQGRWAGEPRPSSFRQWAQGTAGASPPPSDVKPDYVATEKGVVFGLFPDRLKLSRETIVGKEKWEKAKDEMASRGGGFVPTIKLDERDLQAAVLIGADLRGVSLINAVMRGADLEAARFDDAQLSGAQLQGADLSQAQLQGADLKIAQLQSADLWFARLQGADLGGSQLQGANLSHARMQGGDVEQAELQGADFRGAQLQGANIAGAGLQGADLRTAALQGANLMGAQLQGADLDHAEMGDSEVDGTFVFGTTITDTGMATAAIRSIEAQRVKLGDAGKTEPLNPPDVDAWIAAATEFAWEGDKARISQRFDRLKLDPNGAQYHRRLADRLGHLACDPEGAPSVARALVTPTYVRIGEPPRSRLSALGDQLESVRKRMKEGRKTPENCPGVAGFTESDWRRLDGIIPNDAPHDDH
jgi:uncharacterized protein YjbI with pentapeptide repeats